jgi:hypothetical protein
MFLQNIPNKCETVAINLAEFTSIPLCLNVSDNLKLFESHMDDEKPKLSVFNKIELAITSCVGVKKVPSKITKNSEITNEKCESVSINS